MSELEVVMEAMVKHGHLDWIRAGRNRHHCVCGWDGPVSLGIGDHKGWHAHRANAIFEALREAGGVVVSRELLEEAFDAAQTYPGDLVGRIGEALA